MFLSSHLQNRVFCGSVAIRDGDNDGDLARGGVRDGDDDCESGFGGDGEKATSGVMERCPVTSACLDSL